MKKYSIEELIQIRESKHWITHERYKFYAVNEFKLSERDANRMFEEYHKFPFVHKESDKPLEIAQWIIDNIQNPSVNSNIAHGIYDKFLRIKLICVSEKGATPSEVELNLFQHEDVKKYLMLIENNYSVIPCTYVSYYYSNSKTINLYEGDVYHTHDLYWGDKSNTYAVIEGKIKRLLYVKGVGYLSGFNLNLDEGSYSEYAILGKNPVYMGNILHTKSFLKDTNEN